jgi:hypothetical protein
VAEITKGIVRPFVADDIPQVADMHRRIFGVSDAWSKDLQRSYRRYFDDVFLNNPWYDDNLCSLVFDEGHGKLKGFLGVMPRPMWMRGRLIRAAVSSQFIVEPASRSRLVGIQLLKAFLSGSQDLSLADEANESSRGIWERLGGSTALLYSIHWTCTLRPAQYVRLRLNRRRLLQPLALGLKPLCRAIDSVAARAAHRFPSPTAPRGIGEDSDLQTLLECSDAFRNPQSLRPQYNVCSLEWVLGRSSQTDSHGSVRKVAVKNASGELIGCFLYHLNGNGIGEVLQIGSNKTSAGEVLDCLFHHAWHAGAVALRGRLEPGLMPELLARRELSHYRRYWTLVHSRKPELLEAIYRGDAFLTRLEGEWCMRFQKGVND